MADGGKAEGEARYKEAEHLAQLQRIGLLVQLLERLDQREREQRALDERPQEGLAAAPPRVDAYAERLGWRLGLARRGGDCLGVDRVAQSIDTRGRVRHAAGRVVAGCGRGHVRRAAHHFCHIEQRMPRAWHWLVLTRVLVV
eukprot:scaffold65118_cov60-Phaeocystis_antarctica.AAC.2